MGAAFHLEHTTVHLCTWAKIQNSKNCYYIATMTKINVFGVVGILLIAGVAANNPIRIAPKIYVTRPLPGEQSTINSVNGLRSCGGRGQLIAFRYEQCQGSGICQVQGDGQKYKSELEFTPSVDMNGLGVRFLLISDGEVYRAYDRPIADSSVEGRERYVVHAVGGATEDLKGKTVIIQYLIYEVETDDVEICAEADMEVV